MENEDDIVLKISRREAQKIIDAIESQNAELIEKIKREIDEDELLME